MGLDCEQALIRLCKVTPRVTYAREQPSRDNEFIVTSLFAIGMAGIRTARILREKVDCKQFTMGCSMYFPGSLYPTVFLSSSVGQVTNKCKNNRYILGDRK